MLKLLLPLSILLLFLSCGGTSQHEPREIKTLYFKGSAVNGIDYHCGERQGVTKTIRSTDGAITCVYSPVEFYLGSLYLGEVSNTTNQQNIYPQSLVPSFDGDFNNINVLKIAIFLQSLNSNPKSNLITISEETKSKITLTTLDGLTIEQLYKEIEKIGFIPVSKENAKIHLILNSENTNSGKPTISSFEEDISTTLMVGSIIGKIVIDAGDGTVKYPFLLEGEDARYFLLNDKGNLILTRTLDEERVYNFTVTVTNEYGYTTKNIKIHAKDNSKIGKVQMGRLKGATVKLFKLNLDGSKTLLASTTTKAIGTLNQIGNFDLMEEQIDDHGFYIYEVTGGVDIDRDNDGKEDKKATPNQGKSHLLTKGIWVKNSMSKVRITPLSEMLYTYIKKFSHLESETPIKYNTIEEQLNQYATLLLKESLDSEQGVDVKDIIIFDPIQNQKSLLETLVFNQTYQKIGNKIRAGDLSYKSDIFSAYVVDSFQSNAIEIVGSSIYTIDMMKSGDFSIYDLETKKLIGKIKLPHTPIEEDIHVIYINLFDNEIRVSSLEGWSYYVDIRNQTEIKLYDKPFIEYTIFTGRFNDISIGRSKTKNIFSKEQKLYLYDILQEEETIKVKFFKISSNEYEYQNEFDSQLSRINTLWIYKNYLYIVGDNKIHIFEEKNNLMHLVSTYDRLTIKGDILGVEENILYILYKNILTLLDINNPLKPRFLESISVPFRYKLGIKTNGKYITTGSKILHIKALIASKNAN
jgi:hypothetical protein